MRGIKKIVATVTLGAMMMCNTITVVASPLYEATIVNVNSAAIIRESASKDSARVGSIPKYETVQIRYYYHDDDYADLDYVHVIYGEQSGWVHKNFLRHHGEQVYDAGDIVNVKSKLNVRSGPSTNYEVIDGLANGTDIQIMDKFGSWYKIKLDYDKEGYVSEKYVRELEQGYITNVNSAAIFRSEASSSSERLGSISKLESVGVIDSKPKNGYIKVKYNNQEGYVHSKYVNIR